MKNLKSGREWSLAVGDQIMDADGWRRGDGITFDTPITLAEYEDRKVSCTMHMGYFNEEGKRLRKPQHWSVLKQVYIKDRDGWRESDALDWETPITESDFLRRMGKSTTMYMSGDLQDEVRAAYRELEDPEPVPVRNAKVQLFKPSGKYYDEDEWEIPADAIGPYDMRRSKDFRTIGGGAVYVEDQDPWGYPYLIQGDRTREVGEA